MIVLVHCACKIDCSTVPSQTTVRKMSMLSPRWWWFPQAVQSTRGFLIGQMNYFEPFYWSKKRRVLIGRNTCTFVERILWMRFRSCRTNCIMASEPPGCGCHTNNAWLSDPPGFRFPSRRSSCRIIGILVIWFPSRHSCQACLSYHGFRAARPSCRSIDHVLQ